MRIALTLSIHSNGAAMETKEDMARLLRIVADQLEQSQFEQIGGILCDRAGVRVGHYICQKVPHAPASH